MRFPRGSPPDTWGLPATDIQRRSDLERLIQRFRCAAAAVAILQLSLDKLISAVSVAQASALVVLCLAVHLLLALHPPAAIVAWIGRLAMAGDTLLAGSYLLVDARRVDPAVILVGVLIAFEGALRGGRRGGLAAGAVAGGVDVVYLRWHEVVGDPTAKMSASAVSLRICVNLLLGFIAGAAVDRLEGERRALRRTLLVSRDVVAVVDFAGTIRSINPASLSLFGYSPDEMIGTKVAAYLSADSRSAFATLSTRMLAGESVTNEVMAARHRDGRPIEIELSATSSPEDDVMYLAARDITERRRAEGRLTHRAFHDDLTGLPNRALFGDRLGQALARLARSPDGFVAILLFDLDRFKPVNDTLGHQGGDELLVGVAERVQQCIRGSDTLARFGGDEFTILLEGIGGAEEATDLAARIRVRLGEPFRIGPSEVEAGASIGVAIARGIDGVTGPDLLRRADAALYRAKELGRGRWVVYDDELSARADARLAIEERLHDAVRHGELRLHHQVIIDNAGNPAGVEAFVRWQHPERGLLLPAEFVPVAEEIGLMGLVTTWVLDEACAQLAAWRRRDIGWHITMSVNLSGLDLIRGELSGQVAEILTRHRIEPSSLILEVPEEVLVQDPERAIRALGNLRTLGVGIALEDMGGRIGALSAFRLLPFTICKIDRVLIGSLGGPEGAQATVQAAALTRAAVDMAHALGVRCAAGEVENDLERTRLLALGCDLIQGRIVAPPLPADEVADLLRHWPEQPPARSSR